jgi:hypothetical protein
MTPTPAIQPAAARFADPAVRNYLFAGLAALLVVTAVALVRPNGSLIAAVVPGLVAVLGLLTRWSSLPVFFVLLQAYFLFSPLGIPFLGFRDEPVRLTHFRLLDLVLAGGTLVYLAAQYRLMSLTDRAFPPDTPGNSPRVVEPPVERPGANVAPGEFGRLFAVLAACVLGGQLLWLVVAEFEADYRRFPPVRVNREAGLPSADGPFKPTDSSSRFLLFTGLAGSAAVATGMVLWYWGLARLTPARARMLLLDVLWREHRRELNRQEVWRAWVLARGRPAAERPRRIRPPGELRRVVFRIILLIGIMLLFWAIAFCVLANAL